MRVALEDGRRLIGGGIGIHWRQLDEDLSVRGLRYPHPEDAQRVS